MTQEYEEKLLELLTINDLTEDERDLVETAGFEQVKKLMTEGKGGTTYYVTKLEAHMGPLTKLIIAEYKTGVSCKRIARKLGKKTDFVYRIINKEIKKDPSIKHKVD